MMNFSLWSALRGHLHAPYHRSSYSWVFAKCSNFDMGCNVLILVGGR